MLRLEIAGRLLAERDLGRLVRLVAPDRQRDVLGLRGRSDSRRQRQRGAGEQSLHRSFHDVVLSLWRAGPPAPLGATLGAGVDWNKLKYQCMVDRIFQSMRATLNQLEAFYWI